MNTESFAFSAPPRFETSALARYWREQYRNEPYYDKEFTFADYLPAYLLGSENYDAESTFEAAEEDLCGRWSAIKGQSRLQWAKARAAVRSGWYHLKHVKRHRRASAQDAPDA